MDLPPWLADASGKPAAAGAIVRNPQLAAMMRRIAAGGADVLYVETASAIADAVRQGPHPGRLGADDVPTHRTVPRGPLCLPARQRGMCPAPAPSLREVPVVA